MDFLEIVATVLGFIGVYLVIRQNIWCWPVGIVVVSIFAYIFFKAKLYSDVGLQIFYIIVQGYGWYYWLRGGKPDEGEGPKVKRMSLVHGCWYILGGVISTYLLGWTMQTYTDASLPYWDAGTTVFSIIAQWLVTRKILECWVVWFVVDILLTGIYAWKGLYPTMILHAAYIGMAAAGLIAWHKSWKANCQPSKAQAFA